MWTILWPLRIPREPLFTNPGNLRVCLLYGVIFLLLSSNLDVLPWLLSWMCSERLFMDLSFLPSDIVSSAFWMQEESCLWGPAMSLGLPTGFWVLVLWSVTHRASISGYSVNSCLRLIPKQSLAGPARGPGVLQVFPWTPNPSFPFCRLHRGSFLVPMCPLKALLSTTLSSTLSHLIVFLGYKLSDSHLTIEEKQDWERVAC